MKRCHYAFLGMLFLLSTVLQAEEFTTLDGDHYTHATLKRVEPDGLVIEYSDGVVKLRFKNLPKDICEKYGYNPSYETQFLAEQHSNEVTAYQRALTTEGIVENIACHTNQPADVSPETKFDFSTLFSNLTARVHAEFSRLHALAFPTPQPSPTPPPPATPEEKFKSMLAEATVDATKLATLCELYPSLAQVILKDKRIKVSGKITHFMVRGTECADMDVDLIGTQNHVVKFSTDYTRYNTEYNGGGGYGYKLVKEHNQLLEYSMRYQFTDIHSSERQLVSSFEKILYTVGDAVTFEGVITNISNQGDIEFHWSPGIDDRK